MNLNFDKLDGLIPAVIQDQAGGRVLMLGFMNAAAFERTLATGLVTFYSRSRRCLWTKGETSGHSLKVCAIATDCDCDTLLIQVEARGPGVCHDGYATCFYRALEAGRWLTSEPRAFDPDAVYKVQV